MDDELRRLERAAAAGDPEAAARLAAARRRVGPRRAHVGSWESHDDDCRCAASGNHCNRGGSCWSCCGACKKDSECSGEELHPTHWNHPKFSRTFDGYEGERPRYKSDEELRRIAPEAFGGVQDRRPEPS